MGKNLGSVSMADNVYFFTHAFQRDFRVVLDPRRLEGIISSHRFDFNKRVLLLNNFDSYSDEQRAWRLANNAKSYGLVDEVFFCRDFLSQARLAKIGLDHDWYWRSNPWFSAAQFSALIYALEERVDYLFHCSGDVWLERSCSWMSRAIHGISSQEKVVGANLCRNIYVNKYPLWANVESDEMWISEGDKVKISATVEEGRGWGLNDIAYILDLRKFPSNIDFSGFVEAMPSFAPRWPKYAVPCFEMFFLWFIKNNGFDYGAIKPDKQGCPLTKHKNHTDNKLKQMLYLALGCYYPGGRWAAQK